MGPIEDRCWEALTIRCREALDVSMVGGPICAVTPLAMVASYKTNILISHSMSCLVINQLFSQRRNLIHSISQHIFFERLDNIVSNSKSIRTRTLSALFHFY